MNRKLALLLLLMAVGGSALAEAIASLRLEVALTIGERSKDSSSETQTITVERNKIAWEQSSTGHGGDNSAGLRKEFPLSASEQENLRKLIRANDLLVTETIDLPRSTPNFYFELSIDSALDEKKGVVKISGPRSATAVREEALYRKALPLVHELYRILHAHDKNIRFEEFIREPTDRSANLSDGSQIAAATLRRRT